MSFLLLTLYEEVKTSCFVWLRFFGIFTSATKSHPCADYMIRLGLGKERPMEKKDLRDPAGILSVRKVQ